MMTLYKKLSISVFLLCSVMVGSAQSVYDAVSIAQEDLNGTARFVGMGGAMSALGGDISTMGTNPAGIGIYRSNDAMITFGYSATATESSLNGNKFEMGKNRWSLDNIGFVLANKFSNVSPLRYVNFGFNYKKSKSFYKNMSVQGMLGSFNGQYVSQVNYMAQQATDAAYEVYRQYGEYIDFAHDNIFDDNAVGWLGALGFNGALLSEDIESFDYNVYDPIVPSEVDGYFRSRERGGIDQYDFNVAFNISDRFYFGLTIGAYDVDYNKYTLYDELYTNKDEYFLESFNRISGSGFNAKFGAIIRPFEESSFRIGFSVHTPIYYKLTYTTGAHLESDVMMSDGGQEHAETFIVDTRSFLDGRDMEWDFKLETPWVINASLGYTVGSALALGAEYEYENYSNMKFKYPTGEAMDIENNEMDLCLKGVHTARVGLEYHPIPAFAFRAGYNYSTAAYQNNAIKYLPTNSVMTDTDFSNNKSLNTFTLGIGYRGSVIYADLAYKYDTYKSDFYPFYNELADGSSSVFVTPSATKVLTSRSHVLFTLGFRF